MDGPSGGLLWFVNIVGGIVLYVLMGSAARKESNDAKYARLITGGLVLGVIAGVLVYLWLPYYVYADRPDENTRRLVSYLATPAVLVVLVLILERIRARLN